MNKLWFTIGLPRSGKSTLARKWLRGENDIMNGKFTDDFKQVNIQYDEEGAVTGTIARIEQIKRVVVSPDAWRLALGHRYNWYAEPVVFSHVQVAVRALLHDYDVLVDDTHTSIESIKRIFEIDPYASYAYVDTPLHICQERAIATNQADLASVMARMQINIYYLINSDAFSTDFSSLRTEVVNHSSRKIVV